jgi:hypothetical protein
MTISFHLGGRKKSGKVGKSRIFIFSKNQLFSGNFSRMIDEFDRKSGQNELRLFPTLKPKLSG